MANGASPSWRISFYSLSAFAAPPYRRSHYTADRMRQRRQPGTVTIGFRPAPAADERHEKGQAFLLGN
jgi:hypothetical protein